MNGEITYRTYHRSNSPSFLNSPLPIRQLSSNLLSFRSRTDYNLLSVSSIRSSSLAEISATELIPETIPSNLHATSQTMISESISRVATQANETAALNPYSVGTQETVDGRSSSHFVEVRYKKTNCYCSII